MEHEAEDEVPTTAEADPGRVAGLLEDADADNVADSLSERGIPAHVADGGFAAEGRFGNQLLRGTLAGALIAVPIGAIVALVAWFHNHASVDALVPLFFVGGAIVVIGAGLGAFIAQMRGGRQVEERTAMVVAEPPTEVAADEAAQTIRAAGGVPTEPVTERVRPRPYGVRDRAELE